MLDIYPTIQSWATEGKTFATATVIKTWGSSPRPIGSVLAVSSEMEMIGSVSGGCIEGAVVREALSVLESGQPKSVTYGVSDEDAWEVGLSCGGSVAVFIEPFVNTAHPALWQELDRCISQNESCVLLSNMTASSPHPQLVHPQGEKHSLIEQEALRAYTERKSQVIEQDGEKWFAQVLPRKSQLILIGSAHISVDLVALAQSFGFETIVIDPRGIFAHKTQFPTPPDHLHVSWPAEALPAYPLDPYTYLVMLTHDPKIDDQALALALRSEVAYIGALGSKRTAAKRRARLTEAGFTEAEIDRIHGPVGVSIQAKKPREIALSILAEIISVQNAFL